MNSSAVSALYTYTYGYKDITFITFESIISILATIGNGLIIFAFIREPRLRRKSNFYIISLACADFLVGLIGIPFGVLSNFLPDREFVKNTCPARISICISFCNISINSLVLISIKRYIILSKNRVQNIISMKTMTLEIGFCWIIGIVTGFIPLFKHKDLTLEGYKCFFKDVIHEHHAASRLILLLVCVLVLAFIYFKIYGIISNQARNEKRLRKLRPNPDQKETNLSREIKVTITIAMIVVLFVIGWIPINIIYTLNLVNKSLKIDKAFYYIFVVCAHSISAINPMLYAYNMKDVRKVMFHLKEISFETSTKH